LKLATQPEEITTGSEGFDPSEFTVPCSAGDGDINTLQNFISATVRVVRDMPYFPPEEYGTDRGRLSGAPAGGREGLYFHNWECLSNYVADSDAQMRVMAHTEENDPYDRGE
jgi:hypothetical protein